MNLKLGFATAVNYALIGVAFWMGFVCTGVPDGYSFCVSCIESFSRGWRNASRSHTGTRQGKAKLTLPQGLSRIGGLLLWGENGHSARVWALAVRAPV